MKADTLTNKELLVYLLERTPMYVMNKAIKHHRLDLIHEHHKSHLLTHFFDQHELRYAVRMAAVINEVQSPDDVFKSKELEARINKLKFSISYDRKNNELIREHNALVIQFREINKPVNKLVKTYKKIIAAKSKATTFPV